MSTKHIDLLIDELAEQNYKIKQEYANKSYYSQYLVGQAHRISMAKVYKKKDIFKFREYRNILNRELAIADLVKKNFTYLQHFENFFYTKNYAVFIYEFCQTGSLYSVTQTDKFQPKEIVIIARDIFHALEEMKFQNIIHKNLNLKNIFFSRYSIKVGGYSHCELYTHQKMTPIDFHFFQKGIEFPQTLCPEMLINRVCTFKSPQYSFGAIIYNLFHNGQFHIDEKNINKLKNIIVQKDFFIELHPDIEKIIELKTLFYGLLQVDARDRISFVELRDFMNKQQDKFKDSEDEIRYKIFNKGTRGVSDFRKVSLKKSDSTVMKEIKSKPYNSKSQAMMTTALSVDSASKMNSMYQSMKETHGELFLNQTRKMMKSVGYKKDIEYEQVHNKAKYPQFNPIFTNYDDQSLNRTKKDRFSTTGNLNFSKTSKDLPKISASINRNPTQFDPSVTDGFLKKLNDTHTCKFINTNKSERLFGYNTYYSKGKAQWGVDTTAPTNLGFPFKANHN